MFCHDLPITNYNQLLIQLRNLIFKVIYRLKFNQFWKEFSEHEARQDEIKQVDFQTNKELQIDTIYAKTCYNIPT